MKTREFLKQLDDAKVIAAIQSAEQKTSGEIRLFISESRVTDPVAEAEAQFAKLGMTRTKARNGVLIFFAPKSQAFAIVGDTAIHEKCGQTFWEEIASAMREELKSGHYTAAVCQAIERAGTALAAHFPREGDDRNELPDEVIRG